eukprot:5859860-Pleurochrysis_carterae.AAC.2
MSSNHRNWWRVRDTSRCNVGSAVPGRARSGVIVKQPRRSSIEISFVPFGNTCFADVRRCSHPTTSVPRPTASPIALSERPVGHCALNVGHVNEGIAKSSNARGGGAISSSTMPSHLSICDSEPYLSTQSHATENGKRE